MSDPEGGSSVERDPLTSAESQVLELTAEDYTNAQIVGLLVCSPDTVKSHVSHILRKLGVSDRREAARWWREKISRHG